jgi:hypothetical protein
MNCYLKTKKQKYDASDSIYRCEKCRRAVGVLRWFDVKDADEICERFSKMQNSEQKAQECDATDDESRTTA